LAQQLVHWLIGLGRAAPRVGSGWGDLGLHLARNSKVSVTGINLSDEQVKIARHRDYRVVLRRSTERNRNTKLSGSIKRGH
jgi:cyclopropane fatty-acyl-phospholipid synthase-like methyltransferase